MENGALTTFIYGLNFAFWNAVFSASTIMDKIYETNYNFHVKQRNTGELQFLFFSGALQVSKKKKKKLNLEDRLGTRL